MFQIEVVRGVIGQKVCLYLGAVAGYHPFIAKKVSRRRLFRQDIKVHLALRASLQQLQHRFTAIATIN